MQILMEVSAIAGGKIWFIAVYVLGFIGAVSIGSIAWYNSKRPVGWEDKDRPDVVPEIKDNSSSDA
jgi:hypothetical protein